MKLRGLRRFVADIEPYSAGKAAEAVQVELGIAEVIKIGSNENPYGPFPGALEAMQRELGKVNLYPDTNFGELRELLGRIYDVSPDQIALSHGAEGMVQTLGRCFIEEGDEVIVPQITYTLYKEISRLMGATIVSAPMEGYTVDLDRIVQAVSPKTKLVWLANPNNPTGTIFNKNRFEAFLSALPAQTWVIMDEAYREFAAPGQLPDVISLVNQGFQVISLRTFSKVYGLAGVRLGYTIAHPEMIRIINTVSEPFNANRPGIAGAMAVLTSDRDAVQASLNKIVKVRKRMESALRAMDVDVVASSANFVFFETEFDAEGVSQELLENAIIVRPCDVWGCTRAIRVTVGTARQVDRFLNAMEAILRNLRRTVKS